MTGEASNRPLLVQAPGPALADAAAWVGGACWAELRWHQVLTVWLEREGDPAAAMRWWTLRADAAERAEAWHRRLPELREFPRADFVMPPAPAVVEALDGGAEAAGEADGRATWAARVLDILTDHYRTQREIAVGCADAPVARTLSDALASLASNRRGSG